MALKSFQPTGLKLFGWAQDARLSSGGDRVAWSETTLDYSSDEPASRIMVASADGNGQPRRFSGGRTTPTRDGHRTADGWPTRRLSTGHPA